MVATIEEAEQSALAAGLRYVNDGEEGMRRRRAGRGFRYLDPSGEPVREAQILERIAVLAIPPAWTDVWICTEADGHIQATGRDTKGRKQYIYHPEWRRLRDETKFHRLTGFARALPRIRAAVDHDLRRHGLPREKIVATIVRLLDVTLIRIGNDSYAEANDSYGLTTLQPKHADICGSTIRLTFTGKSGREWRVKTSDRRVARVIRACQELPGQRLFKCEDEDGVVHRVDSTDVNDWLQEKSDEAFTAKDFRTWAGTVLAAERLAGLEPPQSKSVAQRAAKAAIREVAETLGNTVSICRKSYIHPAVVEAYLSGALRAAWALRPSKNARLGLSDSEKRAARFLEGWERASNR